MDSASGSGGGGVEVVPPDDEEQRYTSHFFFLLNWESTIKLLGYPNHICTLPCARRLCHCWSMKLLVKPVSSLHEREPVFFLFFFLLLLLPHWVSFHLFLPSHPHSNDNYQPLEGFEDDEYSPYENDDGSVDGSVGGSASDGGDIDRSYLSHSLIV